jgi:4a-hydroxytetrahydrobiopterin dehydratase
VERKKLEQDEVRAALSGLDGWAANDDRLQKRFEFPDFGESLAFVNRTAELAEAADHHPDIRFGWGYAEFELTTHDRGGITDFDIRLAKQIDAIDRTERPM